MLLSFTGSQKSEFIIIILYELLIEFSSNDIDIIVNVKRCGFEYVKAYYSFIYRLRGVMSGFKLKFSVSVFTKYFFFQKYF